MQAVLHDPEHGYYARGIPAIGGPRADFTTAPKLSLAPARAIAARFLDCHRRSGIRDIIELGPGDGSLSAALRKSIPWMLRRSLRFHLVESSPTLSAVQRQRLKSARCHWHDQPATALEATGGRAFIFSNELVDAFPVRRFRLESGAWLESHVVAAGTGELAETFRPAASLPDSGFFDSPLPERCTIEIHQSYHDWLTRWCKLWTEGEMLTTDYGGRLPDFRRNGPAGTLRAYLLQQRITGPDILANPGRQDLTADVNFDDLLRWGDALGLETTLLQALSEFLSPHHDQSSPTDRQLLAPQGAGSAFLTLVQQPAPRSP